MDFSSFYGGRRGASFVLVKRYSSIQEMITAFKQGGDYKDVNYDEYVMIDTPNKNSADNGKVYRRGYDYTNDLGGAEYVGQIQGPVGYAPHLNLDDYNTVEELYEAEDSGDEKRRGRGEYNTINSLLPGKYEEDGETKYNDEIKWIYCSIRKADASETEAYIGFIFPYLIVEYSANTVDAYYHRSDDTEDFINENLVDRIDDGSHPYYEKWNISVPKGIKGDTFKNFRVIPADNTIESYPSQRYDIAGIDRDPTNPRQVLVYDYYNYGKDSTGEPKTIYLGEYNMIKEISLNPVNGYFHIEYTYGDEVEEYLDWVKDANVMPDGTVAFDYTHSRTKQLNKLIKWVKSVELNNETGDFTIEFNQDTDAEGNPTRYTTNLTWLNGLNIDETGQVTLTYTDGSTKVLEQGLNYIVKTAITDNYHLIIYNSDPSKRQEYIDAGTAITYDGLTGWQDLGSIKDDSGLLIGLNIDIDEVPAAATMDGAIDYLNTTYPNGLTGDYLDQKIATVGTETGEKSFYAFDYRLETWYYLGKLQLNSVVCGAEDDINTQALANALLPGGVWLIVEGEDD